MGSRGSEAPALFSGTRRRTSGCCSTSVPARGGSNACARTALVGIRRYASRPLTVPDGAAAALLRQPAVCPGTGCANSIPSTCSTGALSPVRVETAADTAGAVRPPHNPPPNRPIAAPPATPGRAARLSERVFARRPRLEPGRPAAGKPIHQRLTRLPTPCPVAADTMFAL